MESFPQLFIPGIQTSTTVSQRSAVGVEQSDVLYDESPAAAGIAGDSAGDVKNQLGASQLTVTTGITAADTSPALDGRDSSDVHLPLGMRKRKATEDPSRSAKRSNHGDGLLFSREPECNKFSHLPPEIWHHIFTFLPPPTLGNLKQTSKLFNSYLDPHSPTMTPIPASAPGGSLSCLKPDAIWQASRRCFWPRMPAPLKGCSEVDMWQLVCSSRCQICGKIGTPYLKDDRRKTSEEPVIKAGTAPLFLVLPFAVKTCAECLVQKTCKEIDVLLSPTMPSILIPALPFAFVTDQMVPISLLSLQYSRPTSSPQPQLTKIFWREQVDAIKDEFVVVKKMGQAAAEEWIKGLEERGKEARNDHARWDKWGAGGGFSRMRETRIPPAQLVHHVSDNMAEETVPQQPRTTGPAKIRQGRTREDVEMAKDRRRSEIERRAMFLEPPLPGTVLTYIPSFQAAIQISAPLDDVAWDVLKPRLLAQRDGAEQLAQQSMEQEKQTREKLEEKLATALAKESVDRQWDDMQGPVRAKLAALADQTIREKWKDGRKLNKDNCLAFAAQVLATIRAEFYAHVGEQEVVAKAAGQTLVDEAAEGPWTRKLTLENMKWVFDLKIKPHTEPLRKELFACSGCEGNTRLYGLEGVIQHYAAKHTESLSQGSAVVYWRAEWPADQPFKLDPRQNGQTKRSIVATPAPPAAQATYQATTASQASCNYTTSSVVVAGEVDSDAPPLSRGGQYPGTAYGTFASLAPATVLGYRHGSIPQIAGPPPELWAQAGHDSANYAAHPHSPAETQRPDHRQGQQASAPGLILADSMANRVAGNAPARVAGIAAAYRERGRSPSPMYMRYDHDAGHRTTSQPRQLHYGRQQYRHRSPVATYRNVAYVEGEAPEYEHVRAQPQRRQNVYVYADEFDRPASPPRYAQRYEIIQGRDEHGDYIIRRPIRVGREQYEDDHRVQYRDVDAEYPQYGTLVPPESRQLVGHSYRPPTMEYDSRHYSVASHARSRDGTGREVGHGGREHVDGEGDDYDPRYPTGYPGNGPSGDGGL